MSRAADVDVSAAERVMRAQAHLIGRVPTWLLAREIGVTVAEIEAYEARYGQSNPLRPSTWGPR